MCKENSIPNTDSLQAQASVPTPVQGSSNVHQLPESTTVAGKAHGHAEKNVDHDLPATQECSESCTASMDNSEPFFVNGVERGKPHYFSTRELPVPPKKPEPPVQWTSIRVAPLLPTHFESEYNRQLQPCSSFDERALRAKAKRSEGFFGPL